MMGHEGKLIEIKNKKAKVCLDSLGYVLIAYFDKSKLASAQPPNDK
jgi:hypothetical protein